MFFTEIIKKDEPYSFKFPENKVLILTQVTINKGATGKLTLQLKNNSKNLTICHLDSKHNPQVSLNLTLVVGSNDSLKLVSEDGSSTGSVSVFGLYEESLIDVMPKTNKPAAKQEAVSSRKTSEAEPKKERKESVSEKAKKAEKAKVVNKLSSKKEDSDIEDLDDEEDDEQSDELLDDEDDVEDEEAEGDNEDEDEDEDEEEDNESSGLEEDKGEDLDDEDLDDEIDSDDVLEDDDDEDSEEDNKKRRQI